MALRRDDEADDPYPALHRTDRLTHLRRSVDRRSPESSPRLSRLVGLQYILLAILVGVLFIFGPAFRLKLHPFFAWLIVLYLAGGLMLLRGGRPRT